MFVRGGRILVSVDGHGGDLDAQFYVLSPEGIGGHWPFLFSFLFLFLFLFWLLLWLWIGRCRSQNGIVSQTLGL